MNSFTSVGYFLITTLFSSITFILWIRLFIRYFAIGTFHPVSQTIYKLTAAAIGPVDKAITRGVGARSKYDVPCFTLLLFCELLKYIIINLLFLSNTLPFALVILNTVVDIIIQPCNLLFYAIIIRVIMSWLNPDWHHPVASLVLLVTEPLLRTIRNALPDFGVLDLSPFLAIILLKSITLFATGLLSAT